MKKMMTLACAMIMVAAANAKEVLTEAFSKTCVNVPARVRLVKGADYGFYVEANDSVIAKSIQCTVKDGVLRIGFGGALKPGEKSYDAKKGTYRYGVNTDYLVNSENAMEGDLFIVVTSPDLPALTTSSDYVAITVKAVKDSMEGQSDMSMNE